MTNKWILDLSYNLLLPLRNHHNRSHILTWTFTGLILSVKNCSILLEKKTIYISWKKKQNKCTFSKGLLLEWPFPGPSFIHGEFCMHFTSPSLQQNIVLDRNFPVLWKTSWYVFFSNSLSLCGTKSWLMPLKLLEMTDPLAWTLIYSKLSLERDLLLPLILSGSNWKFSQFDVIENKFRNAESTFCLSLFPLLSLVPL